MKKIVSKMKDNIDLVLSVFVAGAFVAAVFLTTGIIFETNDDKFITEILAGVIALKPDAHVVYINYLLALPISLLYRVTSQVPWYGGFLILLHLIIYFTITYQVLSFFKNWIDKILALGIVMSLFVAHMYCTGAIQYTSTAALLAVTGYICLVRNPEKGKWVFLIFELLAYLLRSKAMLMIQPFGMMIMLGIVFTNGKAVREKIALMAKYVCIIVLILAVGFLGDILGYSNASWKDYERFNDARTTMFDIYGTLTYEEAKPILDKYNVTENEYNSFLGYSIFDYDVSIECIEELEETIVLSRAKSFEIGAIWAELKDTFLIAYLWGINRLRLLVLIAGLVWIVVCRRWKLLLPIGGICLSSMLVWGFLLWQGRLPERVAIPLAFCETSLLVALLFKDYIKINNKVLARILLLVFCLCFAKASYDIGLKEYRYVKEVNEGQSTYFKGLEEIESYCRENATNKYLLEAYSMCYYRGGPLETDLYRQRSSLVTGCWYSNSPVMRDKLRDYLQNVNLDDLKLIVAATENDNYAVIKYIEDKSGRTAVEEDYFTVSHGGAYRVYGFVEED